MEHMTNLEEVKSKRGKNTELVSLTLAEDSSYLDALELVNGEIAEARNIKSKRVRNNVQDALKKIRNELNDLGEVPENGVAFYAGNLPEREGKTNIEMYVVRPDEPIKEKLYRCDNRFYTGPVNANGNDNYYGVVGIDYHNYTASRVSSDGHISHECSIDSWVPNKHKKGGQSQQRYQRFREARIKSFFNKASEDAQKLFLEDARENKLLGLIIAGPGMTKHSFGSELGELSDYVVGYVDTTYSGEESIREAVKKGEHLLESLDNIKEKEAVEDFFVNLREDNGLSEYGSEAVKQSADYGAVEALLVPSGECF